MIAALFLAWAGGFLSGAIVGGLLVGGIVALAFLLRPQDFADLRQRREPESAPAGHVYDEGWADGYEDAVDDLAPWSGQGETTHPAGRLPC